MEEIAELYGVPELGRAAEIKAAELAPVSVALHNALDGKRLGRNQEKAVAAMVVENMKPVTTSFRNAYEGFRSLGLGHKDALDYARGRANLALEADRQYAFGRDTGLSHEEALEFAEGRIQSLTDALVRDSAQAAGTGLGLNRQQTKSLVDEVSKKGAEWWDAALAAEADRVMHEKQYAAPLVSKPVEIAPSAPDRSLLEQNMNIKRDGLPGDVTKLETQVREILGVPGLDQSKGKQVAQRGTKTDYLALDPGTSWLGEKPGTGESLWDAVQQETDARRAAEQAATVERDRISLERAHGLEKQRDAAARAADSTVTTVSPAKTETLGGGGVAKQKEDKGLSGIEQDMAQVAQAAKVARTQAKEMGTYVGGWGENLGDGASGDTLGGGSGGKSSAGTGWRSDQGAEGFVPGGDYDTNIPEGLTGVVTSGNGSVVKSGSGHAVTTGTHMRGDQPQSDPDTRVICTELVAQGRMAAELYHLDLRFAEERLSAAHLRGYHLWAVPLVRWMRRSRRVSALVAGPALWRAEEIAHLLGEKRRGSLRGKIVRLIGEPLCRLIGCWAPETDYRKLYEQETNA